MPTPTPAVTAAARRSTAITAIAAYLERQHIPGPPHDATPESCARQLAAAILGQIELGDAPHAIVGGLSETLARWLAGAGQCAIPASDHARALWRIWRVCMIAHPRLLGRVVGLVRAGVGVTPIEEPASAAE